MKYLLLLLCIGTAASAQGQPADSLFVVLDLTPEMVFTKSIEGPATGPDGRVYLVNFGKNGTIGVLTPQGVASLFAELPQGSIGNGIRFSSKGDMLIADYTGHNILRIRKGRTAAEVLAHEPAMNQPNDIAIAPNGMLFASDPCWKNGTGSIWRVDPNGSVTLLEANMGTTNGIEVSPDGRVLYVNESIQRRIWRYRLDRKGRISNKTLHHTFADFGMDGMRCDCKGNLYVTRHGKGTVAIIDPSGKLIREVPTRGKLPSNITFGGSDGKTCFVTLQDRGCVEIFRTDTPGREF